MKKIISYLVTLVMVLSSFAGMTSYAKVVDQYSPTLTETFDTQSNSISMYSPYLTQSYVLKDGTDYWWNVAFPKLDSGLYAQTGAIIASDADEYYIEFDFSTDVCDNFSVSLVNSNNTAPSLSLSMVRHGYMVGTNLTPTPVGVNNSKDVFDTVARVAADAHKDDWYKCSPTQDYVAGQTYTGRYVFNKTDNTIALYLDDVLLRSTTVTDVTAYTKLMIYAHYSGSNNATKNFRLDNVEVGTVSEATVAGDPVNVTSAEISDNGALTLVFDGEVDGATLTADTVKVVMNGVAAAYTNAVYDAKAKTWSATISDFNPFYSVKVSVSGAKGTDDNSVVDFEKVFSGKEFILNPVLDENFDDGEIDNTNWGNKYLTETFDDVSGRGKVWTIPFGVNMAASAVSGQLSGLGQYMTGDVNYIKFDFSTTNCYNFTFAPLPAGTYTHYLNLSTSILGWMYANSFDVVNTTGLNNSQNVLDTNTKDAINRGADWRRGAEAVDYVAGKWYTVTYILDKSEGKIKLYLDDVFQYEVSVSADILATIDRVYIWNHKSTKDSTVSRYMSLDNLEVGTVTKAKASDFVLTNGAVNGTTITGVKEAKYYDEAKAKEVRRFNFDKKSYGADTAGSTDVRASLDGFKKFMTDENVNTISFDYKITGTSNAHIGLFLAKDANDYANKQSTGILLNNSQGIMVLPKVNWNQGYSDWYGQITSNAKVFPNNREWNKLTLEVNNKTGEVTAYINRQKFTVCANVTAPANPPIDMNSICFQTAGEVANDGDLAILMDNIVAYPGSAKIDDIDYVEIVNADGTAIDKFNAGDTLYVSAGVKNEKSKAEDYIAILAVYNEYDACVYTEIYELKDVQAGQNGIIDGTTFGFDLPDDAVTVKAFLWKSWNSLAPVCLFDTATLTSVE